MSGQPSPLKAPPVGLDGREKFRNFENFERARRNPRAGEAPNEVVARALTIDVITRDLFKITGD